MSEQYMTSDFWLGGVLLSEAGAKLVDVQINRNGRETVVFSFKGKNLSQVARAYCNQEAVANVTQLREKINLLRDYIFQTRTQS